MFSIDEKLYEEIFIYLKQWSKESRAKEELNSFFYMRKVKDDRFKKGYWFPGTDEYICLSFWSGGDTLNKTPNLFFEISEKRGCSVFIVARDSESKFRYFGEMVNFLKQNDKLEYSFKKTRKTWKRILSKDFSSWEKCLNTFLENDKKIIDEYINDNQLKELEEFASPFGFISAKNFDSMYSRVLEERARLKEETKPKTEKSLLKEPNLPFAILGISIENFQGVKSTAVDELPSDARWIFVTGENGYGKTTVLQAIALGLSEDPSLEKYLDEKSRISLQLTSQNETAFLVRTKGNISKKESYEYDRFVLGYGPARLNVQSVSSENKEDRNKSHVMSLFENDTLLKSINYELFASRHSDLEMYSELEELIRIVTDGRVSEVIVEDREVLFVERLSNGDKLEPFPLSKLAAGFRSIINIVFDIYLRLRNIHLSLKYSEFYGIVLIDEIENHLHPILQRELPQTLSKVFPKIQFIISTHSPIPLLGAKENAVILRINRAKEEGVTIERLDDVIDFPTLLPNTILTSPIFGFQDIFSESKDDEDFIRVEKTYQEVIENNEQTERISKHLNKKTTDEILKLLRN